MLESVLVGDLSLLLLVVLVGMPALEDLPAQRLFEMGTEAFRELDMPVWLERAQTAARSLA